MKDRDGQGFGRGGGRLLRAEIEEIESMTSEEVRAGLRGFGIEPTEVLPWELKRLLAAEPPARAPGHETSGRYRAAVRSLLWPFARPIPVWAVNLFFLGVLGLGWFVNPEPVRAAASTFRERVAAAPRPRGELLGARQSWFSDKGVDTNPCTRTAPCGSLTVAVLRTAPGGEVRFIDASGSDKETPYKISD